MSKNIFDYQQDKKPEVDENLKQCAEELVSHYQNFSQEELMQELFKVARNEKEKGVLTKEKLQEIKATITPYLNESQIEFLEQLIKKLNV